MDALFCPMCPDYKALFSLSFSLLTLAPHTPVPTNFLLFGRTVTDTLSRISMVSLDTDSDVSVLLPFQIPGYGANYISYDITTLSVYWDEMSPPAIKRSEIDSGEVDTFISTDIRRVSGM